MPRPYVHILSYFRFGNVWNIPLVATNCIHCRRHFLWTCLPSSGKQTTGTLGDVTIQYTSGAEKSIPAVNETRATDCRLVACAVVGFKYSATLRINGYIFGCLYLEGVARSIYGNQPRTDTETSVPYFVHQWQLSCKHQTLGLFPHWY